MSMYEYVGMRESGKDDSNEAQDELYINGKTITSQIDGYKQLTVSRPNILPFDVETVQNARRSGARPLGYRTEVFDVTVKYIIRAETSAELQQKKDQLSDILRKGALVVWFKDDERYMYKDVFITGNVVEEETSNTMVWTYTLTFLDPYKYEKEQSEGEVVELEIDGQFVEVDEIRVNFAETVDRPTVVINNGIYKTSFRLVGTYVAGSEYRLIVQKDTGMIRQIGGNVEIGTLPRELVVFNGATGEVEGSAGSVTFKWGGFRA